MQNLINSMVRFSAAISLFSLEQLERAVSAIQGDAALSKTMDNFEEAMNAMTDVLTSKIDADKKETLSSVTSASEDMVKRTLDGMRVLDPREMMKASNDLMKRTTSATSEWISKAAAAVEDASKQATSGNGHAA
ncbi:MAG TPA: hypothetical protein VJN43_13970 [Bryobacteraceae bacterium]|nr:hypothetical protein [Bryobacteraceae bacterium]